MSLTYRAVVLQWSLQTLKLGRQRVMALGHQHDAVKTETQNHRLSVCSNAQNTAAAKEAAKHYFLPILTSGS